MEINDVDRICKETFPLPIRSTRPSLSPEFPDQARPSSTGKVLKLSTTCSRPSPLERSGLDRVDLIGSGNVSLHMRSTSFISISRFQRQTIISLFLFQLRGKRNVTRSSATAEKQRVSCPHGGGLGPPAHSPVAPSGYTYAYMVESETRNKRTSSVPSVKRTLSRNRNTANSSISTTQLKFEDVPARNAFEYLQMIYTARNENY